MLFVLGAFFMLPSQASAQCGDRYQDSIFTVSTVLNVKYGENYDQDSVLVELFADIYYPDGDTVTDRPLAIIAHGGSFYGGNRTQGDVVGVARGLAKRGFVAASISYRLTTIASLANPDNMVKAVMRAVQDGKGAIRFFKNSVENGNTYGIDSTRIFIGGSSAGAILAYHVVYMDDTAALSANWQLLAAEVGGLEGNSGNPEHTTSVIGTFGYAGALADTSWLENSEVPFMGMHAEDDATVPYGRGFPLGVPTLPTLYGTSLMAIRATNVGVDHDFYSYTGAAHPPYQGTPASVFDSTIVYTAKFMQKHACVSTGILDYTADLSGSVQVYPNPSNGQFTVEVKGHNAAVVVGVYNMVGQLVSTVQLDANQAQQFDMGDAQSGIYLVRVSDANTGSLLANSKLIIQ